MIDVFNISQKLFGYKQTGPETEKTSAEINFAVQEAEHFAEIAEQELRHGGEAFALSEKNNCRELKIIAEWHFRRCTEKARLAEDQYRKAGRLQTKPHRGEYCRIKAAQMSEILAQAERFSKKLSAEII